MEDTPNLAQYLKDSLLADKVKRYKSGAFWIPVVGGVVIGNLIPAGNVMLVVAAVAALLTCSSIYYFAFFKRRAKGWVPTEPIRYALSKLLKNNELEATLGRAAMAELDQAAANLRRIEIAAFGKRLAQGDFRPINKQEKKLAEAVHTEMDRLLRLLEKFLTFKQPVPDAVVLQMSNIRQELGQLADLLESEETTQALEKDPSALREILEETEARIAARAELDQTT